MEDHSVALVMFASTSDIITGYQDTFGIWKVGYFNLRFLNLQDLWRSLIRNSLFRVVLGLSSLKGLGALTCSHPTRWTFFQLP